MNLHEYQSKQLLENFDLPTAKSVVVFSEQEISSLISELDGEEFVVKVQVHAGGRGKVGGVKITNDIDEIIEFSKDWLGKKFVNHQTGDEGKPVSAIMIAESTTIQKEFYLGAVIDRSSQSLVVMASPEGGMDIEKVAEESPEKIFKINVSKNKKEDFPIAGINIPAKVVSGDFYNFSDLGDGKYGFGVADVSGKGIKSSLLMSKASSLYSCLSKTNFSAAELLIQLNNEICETISRGMFVTMLIGIYDSNKKELLLSSAGHEPPIIFSKDGTFSNYNESGPPLGIMPKTKYTEHTIPFDNSSMYIFTDGITEIKNPKGEMLGSEGFQNYIQKYKDKPNNERLKIIIEDILNTGHIQKDDLTIVVIDGNN